MNPTILKAYIDDQVENNVIKSLSDFIRIPNLSPEFDPNWKTNGLQEQAAKHLVTWADNQNLSNYSSAIIQDEGYTPLIFIEIGASETTDKSSMVLYGHLDKQPAFTGWKEGYGPTIPIRDGDRLYGRGSCDDGYSIYAAILSIKAIQQQKQPFPRCVIIIEGSEESGSVDLPYYLTKIKDRIGSPNLIVCMDSGLGDYNRLWMTSSLRGAINFDVTVQCLSIGIHSGKGTGVAPDSFMILRNIMGRVENSESGIIKLLEVEIPEDVISEAKKTAEILGDEVTKNVPVLPGVKFLSDDISQLLINNTWKPSLVVAGASGFPKVNKAGNVLRPFSTFRLSFRTPPTLDSLKKKDELIKAFSETLPYNSSIKIENAVGIDGWRCPVQTPELKESLKKASNLFFSKETAELGVGGSIPFMQILYKIFPEAQFAVTGVVNMDSNIHGPNENLNIEYLKKFISSISILISDYKTYIK